MKESAATLVMAGISAATSLISGTIGLASNKKDREEARGLASIQRQDIRDTDLMKQATEQRAQTTNQRRINLASTKAVTEDRFRKQGMKDSEDAYEDSLLKSATQSNVKGLGESLARNVKSIERLRQ